MSSVWRTNRGCQCTRPELELASVHSVAVRICPHVRVAVLADEAEFAAAVLVVPVEVEVGPHVDTPFVAAVEVRLMRRPVPVLVGHWHPDTDGLQKTGRQQPPERSLVIVAPPGGPQIDSVVGIFDARTKRKTSTHATGPIYKISYDNLTITLR